VTASISGIVAVEPSIRGKFSSVNGNFSFPGVIDGVVIGVAVGVDVGAGVDICGDGIIEGVDIGGDGIIVCAGSGEGDGSGVFLHPANAVRHTIRHNTAINVLALCIRTSL